MSFTPAPWNTGGGIYSNCEVMAGRRLVANTGGYSDGAAGTREQNEANARLIAAAPDLLSALKEARDELWRAHHHTMSEDEFHSRYKAIDAAISKATGGSK